MKKNTPVLVSGDTILGKSVLIAETISLNEKQQKFCKDNNITDDQFLGREKVGGDLDLPSVTSIPEGFNPTVGGDLYLGSGRKESTNKPKGKIDTPKNKLLFWKDGKYIKADGIFTEVVNKRGNAYRVKKVHSQKEFYLVTDGSTHAHGDTLKKAKEDFQFKIISEKLKNDPIKPNTKITINYYRLVTGACELGVKSWMAANKMTKESYTAK